MSWLPDGPASVFVGIFSLMMVAFPFDLGIAMLRRGVNEAVGERD